MINTQYINLNMTPSGVLPVLHCSQYDIGRPLGVIVHNGSESVDLSQYTTTIEATRTDGTAITTTVAADGTFATTATMTNKADRYFAQLVLVQNDQRVASLPFVMCVVPAAMDENSEAIQEDASLFAQFSTSMQSSLATLTAESSANSARIDNMIALQTAGTMQGAKITTFRAVNPLEYTRTASDVLPYQSFDFVDNAGSQNTNPSMSVLDGLVNPTLVSAGAYVLDNQTDPVTGECIYLNLSSTTRFYPTGGFIGNDPDKRAVRFSVKYDAVDIYPALTGKWLVFEFSVLSDVPTDLSELTDIRVGANGLTYPTAGDAVRGQISDITSASKNLWSYGNQSFTKGKKVTLGNSLPAGTYTLSAVVTSTGTDTNKSRFIFMNGNTTLAQNDLTRDVRSSNTVTTTGVTDSIFFYAENGGTNSEGDSAVWSDIMIESGPMATAYVSHMTADDTVARGDIVDYLFRDEFTPSFTLASGFVNGMNIGDVWTNAITANSGYRYTSFDVSAYNTYDGYLIVSTPTNPSNSARFGFATSDDACIYVLDNSHASSYVLYNSNTGMYDLFIKVLGDKFFYSNATAAILTASFKLVRIPLAENRHFGTEQYRSTKFVSANGNDGNTGDSANAAYATVGKALSENAGTIIIVPGTYTQNVTASGIDISIISAGAIFEGGSGNRFTFEDCNVNIQGITIQNTVGTNGSGFWFKRCTGKVTECVAKNNLYMGFRISGSQLTFDRCTAVNSGVDGFNGHDDSVNARICDCTFIGCVAQNCGDDGLSFHEHGHFVVMGGEFSGCTSTGIAPHQWCSAEIHGAYIHDNGANAHSSGIEAMNPDYTSGDKARVMTFGNLITNNGKYGIDVTNDILISVGDKFAGNASGTVNTSGTGAEVTIYE